MASSVDQVSDQDSLPDEIFRKSSSVAHDVEEIQYAQRPADDDAKPHIDQASDQEDFTTPGISENQEHNFSDDDDDDYDSEYDRENRFYGPASTWRTYTESERALASSLNQEQASNLSLHLYNAHALKARVRDPEASANVEHHKGKKHWMKADEDGTLPWHPDPSWTAWPLRPEDVPRRNAESFGAAVTSIEDERATYRMEESWKPSAELEAEVQAMMLKTIKDLYRERQQVQVNGGPSEEPRRVSPLKRRRSSSSFGSGQNRAADARDGSRGGQAFDNGNLAVVVSQVEPSILVDDEEATEVLQPSIRHLLGKLDDLLLDLHKSRQGHQQRHRSTSRPLNRTRSRKSTTKDKSAEEGEDSASPDGDHVAATEEVSTKNKPPRRRPLNLRDWGEVLSVASLAGWDPAVVKRAADRCSSLFGESMAFIGPKEHTAGTLERNHDDFVLEPVAKKGNVCPVETCARHANPFEQTWRWREHLKRSHQYSREDIEAVEESLSEERSAQARAGDFSHAHDPRLLRCTVGACAGEGKPFIEVWRWREHLKRVHQYSKDDIVALEANIKGQADEEFQGVGSVNN